MVRSRAWLLVALLTPGLLGVPLVTRDAPAAYGASTPAPGLEGRQADVARFLDPPSDSRPTVLWFWNGKMTEQVVDRQLADMRREGITEAIIFPRGDDPDLSPTFFSEGWFDIIGHALREARDTGMHLWLFNDDYFPSGRAGTIALRGGTVGDRTYEPRPDLRPQELLPVGSKRVTGPGPVDLALPDSASGFAVTDGALRVDARTAGGGGIALLEQGADWRDYTMDVDLKILRNAAGLVVRAQDPQNGILIDEGAGGVVNIYRQVDGALTRIASGTPPGVDPSAYRHVRVEVAGTQVRVLVNGQVAATANDSTYETGTVGLRVVADQLAEVDNLVVTEPDGSVAYRQDFTDERAVEDFDRSAFRQQTQTEDVVAVSALPVVEGSPSLDGVVDVTKQFRAGTTWSAPAGTYELQYVKRSFLSMTGLYDAYLDLLKPAAVDRYLDIVYGEYHRRFPWAFGTVLRGFWDDEPANPGEWGKLAWSDGLPGELADQGRSAGEVLPALFADFGRDGREAKGAYRHAVADGLANYYELSGRWADAHDVALLSNPYTDHFGPSGAVTWGDTFKNDQWFQVPGADAVFNQVLPGKQSVIPRYPAGSGHQQGRDRIAAELMGAYGWGVTPELTRFVTGYMAVRGVNLGVLHAYWSDPSKVIHPPPFQPENTWYDATDGLTDWMGRVMEAGRGQAKAPTALLMPQRAAEAWEGTSTGSRLDSDFASVVADLEDTQVDFDVLPEGSLDGDPAVRQQAEPSDGALRVGPQAYRVVVVPPTPTMSLETVARLQELVRRGGTVIAVDRLAEEETRGRDAALAVALRDLFGHDGPRKPGAGTATLAADTEQLTQAVRDAGAPAARLTPPSDGVRVLRVEHGKHTSFLVMNESQEAVRTTATFPAGGTPTIWDPEDGSVRTAPSFAAGKAGHVSVPLRLAPSQVTVVNLDGSRESPVPHLLGWHGADATVRQAGPRTLTARIEVDRSGEQIVLGQAGGRYFRGDVQVDDTLTPVPLDGPWRFRLDKPGSSWSERALGSWTATDPAWSGSALYETDVDLDAGDLADGRRLRLDLGKVAAVAEVTVNGEVAGRALWSPYTVDVTDQLRPGTNTIRVRVTNTNANEKGSALPSGLLGPVSLKPSRVEDVSLVHDPRIEQSGGLTVVDVQPAAATLTPCVPSRLHATVTNFGRREVRGDLTASGPAGVIVTPASTQLRVAAADQVAVPLDVETDSADPVHGDLDIAFGGQRVSVPVSTDVDPNLARGATVTASSTNSRFDPARLVDGGTDSSQWDAGDGWNDDTLSAFPDSVTLALPCARSVGRVVVDTLDSGQFPASRFGVKDYDVQVRTSGEWQTVDEVRGNAQGSVESRFGPVVADQLRVVVRASNDGQYSRLMEVAAYRE